jgi:NAD(P)-dependent dehydrogenase (short-subunit alcohol dehydrogenase family)
MIHQRSPSFKQKIHDITTDLIMSFSPDLLLLTSLAGKTVIVTGGANGIGLEVIRKCHANGANVVIADLPSAKDAAEKIILELGNASTMFAPVNIAIWDEVSGLYTSAIHRFGRVDIVVANAGIMESRRFFDFEVDSTGKLQDGGWSRVIDVNLKGTMNSELHSLIL